MSDRNLPEYSVLMSVYAKDNPDYFDLAIESMVKQTVPFHDLTLVCDGPLPSGLDGRVAAWQKKLADRLNVVRLSTNGGLGPALAAGMPCCGCDVIARMDSDDISRPDRMEKLLDKKQSDNLELVGGAIEEFDHEPGDMGSVRMPPLTMEEIDTWLKGRNPFNHVSVVYDRHVVEAVGGYEPFPWMEDYWLWARMIAGGCRCANIPDVVVDVRVGEGMYARRSNTPFLISQVRFFETLHDLGLINRPEEAWAIAQRVIATAMPEKLLKASYNLLLREKAPKDNGE